MKIIFLDVDGVLNSLQDGNSVRLRTDSHLKLLKQIVDATGAKIVLSSSWRIGHTKARNNLLKRLEEYGLQIMDSTPVLSGASSRGDEIRQWLNESKYEIESFVILDNEDDMGEFTAKNLVQTNTAIGLQDKDASKCISMLNNSIANIS